jgi:hypothetical protein
MAIYLGINRGITGWELKKFPTVQAAIDAVLAGGSEGHEVKLLEELKLTAGTKGVRGADRRPRSRPGQLPLDQKKEEEPIS